jgi:hypothetical protein
MLLQQLLRGRGRQLVLRGARLSQAQKIFRREAVLALRRQVLRNRCDKCYVIISDKCYIIICNKCYVIVVTSATL